MKNSKKISSMIVMILSIVLAVLGGLLIFTYVQHKNDLNKYENNIEKAQKEIQNKIAEEEEARQKPGVISCISAGEDNSVPAHQISVEEIPLQGETDFSVSLLKPDVIKCNKEPYSNFYDVIYLADGSLSVNWQISYIPQHYESSESCPKIIYKYDQPVSVQYLQFNLGNWAGEDDSEYVNNYRPGFIALRLSKDQVIGLNFEDKKTDYVIALDQPIETNRIEFYLYKTVYPEDTDLENQEMVISEMSVYGTIVEPEIPDEPEAAEEEIKSSYVEAELAYEIGERVSQEPIQVLSAIPFKDPDYSQYPAKDAFDNDASTSWQYNAAELNGGEEQYITAQINPQVPVQFIDFRLGKWVSDSEYLANCRPVSIIISADNYPDLEVQFQDMMVEHMIKLPQPISASEITFKVNSYSIENVACFDVVISDITMWN